MTDCGDVEFLFTNPTGLNEPEWSGDNLLGKMLMKIRALKTDITGDNTETAMDSE